MAHRLIINIEVLLKYICSDHHPLLVNITYSPTVNHRSNIRDQKSSDYKPINWKNLTPRKKADYYQSTKSYLSNLLLPLKVINCNAGCNDSAHLESISTYYQGIINSLQASLPLQIHNSRRNSRIPNWSAVLKNYRKKAKTSYLTWINSSKPKTGPVFELMRKHKKELKKLFRQHKKKPRKQAADTLACSFIDNHPTNQFWKNINIQSSTKTNVLPATINGVSGTQNIVNMWENHYQRLLNSANSSKSSDLSTTHLISETMGPLNKTDKFDEVKKFLCTVDLARSLSQKLKPDCAGGLDGLSANHIMFAHEIIYLHISIFFNLCLVHSYLPAACTNSVITPIVKNKHGNVSAISNYRPIALPTVISKYFEHYILFMTSNFLSSVDNQFGFNPAHSTDMCLFLLKQAILQYNTHGSPVFVAFLDASKAFDKVNHHIFFKKLTECNVPEIFVKLLANWYSSQLLCVRWGTTYSTFWLSQME